MFFPYINFYLTFCLMIFINKNINHFITLLYYYLINPQSPIPMMILYTILIYYLFIKYLFLKSSNHPQSTKICLMISSQYPSKNNCLLKIL